MRLAIGDVEFHMFCRALAVPQPREPGQVIRCGIGDIVSAIALGPDGVEFHHLAMKRGIGAAGVIKVILPPAERHLPGRRRHGPGAVRIHRERGFRLRRIERDIAHMDRRAVIERVPSAIIIAVHPETKAGFAGSIDVACGAGPHRHVEGVGQIQPVFEIHAAGADGDRLVAVGHAVMGNRRNKPGQQVFEAEIDIGTHPQLISDGAVGIADRPDFKPR